MASPRKLRRNGALLAAAWKSGPLITEDGGCVAHAYFRNGALVDSKGNSWSKVGSPAFNGGLGRIPPGTGPLSGTAYHTSFAGMNFAGDFTVALVGMETSLTGSFGLGVSTGNGAVGHVGAIVQSSGAGTGLFYPGASIVTAPGVSAGAPFVLVYGRNGAGFYARISGGTSNRSLVGSHTAGANATVLGQLAGNTWPGVIYEVYATSTAYTDALAASIIGQVGTKIGRSLSFTPNVTQTTAGGVVCIGDSITNGSLVTTPYPSTLQTDLGGTYSVVNAGVNNDRTTNVLTRWNSTYKSTSPKWVVVLAGVNDAIGGLTADSAILNLLTVYESALKVGARVIPMTCTPWNTYASWTGTMGGVTDAINSWIAWWCGTYSVPYVDLNGSALNNGSGALAGIYDSGDHLHPNQAGTDLIESLVRAKFP